MRIVVISPEARDPREIPAMERLFAAGLERYHVRKPAWTAADLEEWLLGLPAAWRPAIVLHGHQPLVERLALGGRHDPDGGGAAKAGAVSRSCHDLPSLRRRLGSRGSIIFGPVFPSITKPGYGPQAGFPWGELSALLKGRAGPREQARVLAIGGITADRLARCSELGFDGAAVHGAVWGAADPAGAYCGIRDAAAKLEGARHAA